MKKCRFLFTIFSKLCLLEKIILYVVVGVFLCDLTIDQIVYLGHVFRCVLYVFVP